MFKQEKAILLILSVVYAIIGYATNSPTMQTLSLLGWLGILQLTFSVISWIKRGNQLISPYVVFLLTLYVFSFGQSFLWAFGAESERSLVGFQRITIPDIFKAQVLTLIMLAFFHIGATSYLINQERRNHLLTKQIDVRNYSNKLKQIGWFLFFISIVPYGRETIKEAIMSVMMGYGALYEGEDAIGLDNLFGVIADYFIPSVICLFIAYKDNVVMRNFFSGILIINIVIILITGGRSNAVILIAILIILYHYLIKKFTRKWIVVGVIGALFLLQILAYVGNTRTEGGRSLSITEMETGGNAAVEAVAEMGGSMFCLIKTMDLIPSKNDYRYGKSYAVAFTTLVPNFGFWAIHPAKKESNLGEWLTETLGLSYGTGFSMCAEAYANFGYLGIIVFYLWGWLFASVFGKIEISVTTRNYVLLAFLLVMFWYILKLPRNNFINIVRPFFFVAGPIYLYCKRSKRMRYDTNKNRLKEVSV